MNCFYMCYTECFHSRGQHDVATVTSCKNTLSVNRNEQAFLEQVTSSVVRYDDIYHSVPINSQYLMMGGGGGGLTGLCRDIIHVLLPF